MYLTLLADILDNIENCPEKFTDEEKRIINELGKRNPDYGFTMFERQMIDDLSDR